MNRIERILEGFDPVSNGLDEDFVLTKLTGMKGCGCKVPRNVLLQLLQTFKTDLVINNDEVDIGLDSCVIPLRHPGLRLVQTTDFFYPLIDDPYIMGRVTCANVLSDLYAMGVSECDNMLMLLAVAIDLNEKQRDIVVPLFIQGFKDAADEAGTKIRGGQTVRCPWLLLGGVATSVAHESEIIKVDQAVPGDVLILTKPIGGQVAVNSYEWIKKKNGKIEELNLEIPKIEKAFKQVCEQMSRLNRNAAKLLHKYDAHSSTDVTGFGLLGHAENLARVQKQPMEFIIEKLPIIEYMDEIADKMIAKGGEGFKLYQGTSAETSGGLLIAMSEENAKKYIAELSSLDNAPAWIIGKVTAKTTDSSIARILPDAVRISVPSHI
ncbi:putative selenide, water dikinase [Caenorhabditis elegans]|uniref:Probable selenide, water dikinase n=1 Tax=Caenorhabditis elegans TaxID=6239 RepID=SELD_CAEEL|nr:putative selenide, water dikinase [Caenorhabditis elegans]O62461.2 RecName: Full=Probable selenide, water dikinase; AltName: Full=Selenium donor protein; AltName: Full=Selenophosphate synthase 1 [Caenorhabditis elegans]CAA16367.2 Probable selenide, water dikinase [Caenorhabditis elegans]|eukprot:NP_502604.1 Probable selenide, water dikinase [Caenorhabditis elegans]